MVVNLTFANWRRIVGAALAAFAGSLLVTMLVVTGYAFLLGFQARGAPDQTRISAFARDVGPMWGPMVLWLFTVCAAMWVARGPQPVRHGVLVGAIAAAAGLVPGWPPDVRDAALFAAVIGAGWIGGFTGQRAKSQRGVIQTHSVTVRR